MGIVEKVMWCTIGIFAGANIGLLIFCLMRINRREHDDDDLATAREHDG